MKKSKLIFGLVLVSIIIISVVAGIFLMKKQTDTPIVNTQTIYVETYDELTREKIKADFVVVINETIVAEGTTNLKGLEEITIPIIENQNTYILGFSDDYYVQMGLFLNNPFSLDLYKKGEIKLIGVSTDTKKINFTIKAENGQYRQLGFCIGWSVSFLDVWNNYIEIEPLSRLKTIDRCYYTKSTLAEDENITITLNYNTIQELRENDEMEIIFFDSDRSWKNKYIVEKEDGSDVGGKDYKYILSSDCLKTGDCNLNSCEGNYCST